MLFTKKARNAAAFHQIRVQALENFYKEDKKYHEGLEAGTFHFGEDNGDMPSINARSVVKGLEILKQRTGIEEKAAAISHKQMRHALKHFARELSHLTAQASYSNELIFGDFVEAERFVLQLLNEESKPTTSRFKRLKRFLASLISSEIPTWRKLKMNNAVSLDTGDDSEIRSLSHS